MKKYIFPVLLCALLFISYCKTPRDRVFKIGIQEGWQDDTRFVVVALGTKSYDNEPAKVAAAEACRTAAEKIPQQFSEFILGGDTVKRCTGIDPATDSYCDWNFRLDPTIFRFKGVELKRRHDFNSQSAVCEIALEYRDADLRGKATAYAARFNITQ
jgi:hypothetical protein